LFGPCCQQQGKVAQASSGGAEAKRPRLEEAEKAKEVTPSNARGKGPGVAADQRESTALQLRPASCRDFSAALTVAAQGWLRSGNFPGSFCLQRKAYWDDGIWELLILYVAKRADSERAKRKDDRSNGRRTFLTSMAAAKAGRFERLEWLIDRSLPAL
jgi:hypothetical protein